MKQETVQKNRNHCDALYDLEIGKSAVINDAIFTRVPGGYIYKSSLEMMGTFVPFPSGKF